MWWKHVKCRRKKIHKFFLVWQHMCNPVDWDLHEENINNSRFNLHHFLEQLYFSGIVLMEIFINKFIPFSPYAPINVTRFFFDEKKTFVFVSMDNTCHKLKMLSNCIFLYKFSMDFHIRITTSCKSCKVDRGICLYCFSFQNAYPYFFSYDLAKLRWHDHGLSETHYSVYCIC